MADLLRVKAEILRLMDADAATIAAISERPLAIAARQGALSYELRSALDAARFWCDSGRAAEAQTLLASILARFTEGPGTADLRAARQLLAEQAAGCNDPSPPQGPRKPAGYR